MPSLSARMPETGERKKVVPTATEPTREALVAESGSSPYSSFSRIKRTPNEFRMEKTTPLHRLAQSTTMQA